MGTTSASTGFITFDVDQGRNFVIGGYSSDASFVDLTRNNPAPFLAYLNSVGTFSWVTGFSSQTSFYRTTAVRFSLDLSVVYTGFDYLSDSNSPRIVIVNSLNGALVN